jgi:hypothetical protein
MSPPIQSWVAPSKARKKCRRPKQSPDLGIESNAKPGGKKCYAAVKRTNLLSASEIRPTQRTVMPRAARVGCKLRQGRADGAARTSPRYCAAAPISMTPPSGRSLRMTSGTCSPEVSALLTTLAGTAEGTITCHIRRPRRTPPYEAQQ